VQLLGDLPLERDGRDSDRLDAGEGQKIGCRERVVLADGIGWESDVEEEGLELPSGEMRGCAEAVASAEALGRRARALDRESEEIAGFEGGGIDQRVGQLLLRCLPVDVDVAGRSGAVRKPQVEREPALEQPTFGRGLNQTSEESIECDTLPVTCKTCAVSCRARAKTLLESLAERCSVAVPHAAVSARRRSMKRRTRVGRLVAAARSRRGVERPRSSAWRTASSICSG
jgi:hypothetical protein